MSTVKCGNCGLVNGEENQICRRCQSSLVAQPQPVAMPIPPMSPTSAQQPRPKPATNQNSTLIAICVTVGILMSLGYVVAIFGPSKPSSTGSSSSSVPSIPDLEMLDYKDSHTEYGSACIIGTVKNNSKKEYRFAMIEFNIYNDKGNQVGTAHDTISNLEPGGTWAFKALVLEKDFARYKFKELKGY